MNKKSILVKAVICFSVLISTNASAVWTGAQTMDRFLASSTGLYVRTDPYTAHIDPGGCQYSSYYRLSEVVMFDKHYQMIMTAVAGNRQISFNIDGCLGAYPKIIGVIIFQ